MASLDTNCLVRWLMDDIPDERARVDRLIGAHEPLDVDDAALIELVFVLDSHYGMPRPLVVEALSQVLALAILRTD
ncbi:MAG: hypothetical protein LBJ08_02050, partial [Bifidobacteriaceae bacterium]|nr:hypothetical protein [Bifidobacteriaceae bacterium]